MPSTLTYPGVYIEEIPSGVRSIAGVSTSNTAFIGFFKRGPMNTAIRITSFSEFERVFGGLDQRSEASYAIQQYYLNGGQIAFVVRVASGSPQAAVLELPTEGSATSTALEVSAISEGVWGVSCRWRSVMSRRTCLIWSCGRWRRSTASSRSSRTRSSAISACPQVIRCSCAM